ncbi:MAG: hypothetical protein Q4P29_05130 [Tissierellia bacterium]|nr:hypothetical protein [Tissierellia bacterium]
MENTASVRIGQIVKSKNGRDFGKVFLIYKIYDEQYVGIINGVNRTIAKPKKKKLKHLMVYKDIIDGIETKDSGKYQFNDAYIRRVLKPFNK